MRLQPSSVLPFSPCRQPLFCVTTVHLLFSLDTGMAMPCPLAASLFLLFTIKQLAIKWVPSNSNPAEGVTGGDPNKAMRAIAWRSA